jgi:hypothetical protein
LEACVDSLGLHLLRLGLVDDTVLDELLGLLHHGLLHLLRLGLVDDTVLDELLGLLHHGLLHLRLLVNNLAGLLVNNLLGKSGLRVAVHQGLILLRHEVEICGLAEDIAERVRPTHGAQKG